MEQPLLDQFGASFTGSPYWAGAAYNEAPAARFGWRSRDAGMLTM